MIDLTPIINAVIVLISALITGFLIPWIKAKISAERFAEIQKWVKIAVEAAEMIHRGTGLGEVKKEYVYNYIKQKGYELDTASINAMIEAAVLEVKGVSGW